MESDHIKFDKIIPAGKKDFSYQQENISIKSEFSIMGYMPFGSGKLEYLNDEKDKVNEYELKIEKFTGNSFTVTLYKKRKDIVEQRNANGFAVLRDAYQCTFDFAEFVNAIFKGVPLFHFQETENFPQEVTDKMKGIYGGRG